MIASMRCGANIGRRVVLNSDPTITGEITLDLRRQFIQPPRSHILLYVRFDRGLGTWALPEDVTEVAS